MLQIGQDDLDASPEGAEHQPKHVRPDQIQPGQRPVHLRRVQVTEVRSAVGKHHGSKTC